MLITKSHADLQLTFSVCGLVEDAKDHFQFFQGGSTGIYIVHWILSGSISASREHSIFSRIERCILNEPVRSSGQLNF